jgi:hypothetical protein
MMESKYEWMFDKLNGYLDMLYESGCLSEDEEEEMNSLNDDIIQTIRELEQKMEVKCNNTRCRNIKSKFKHCIRHFFFS